MSQRKRGERIGPGDEFFCYLVRLQRWVGFLRVTSKMYSDDSPHFAPEPDPFILRYQVEPVVVLPPELGIPIYEIWDRLEMCEGVNDQAMGWAYKVGVARSLGEITPGDATFLRDELFKQSQTKKEYALSTAEQKLVEGKRTVALPSGQATVEIPPEEDEAVKPVASDQRRSIKIQSKLATIGIELGFKIWLPSNDRAAVLSNLGANGSEHVLLKLPLNADDNTVETVERIDVLWIKGRSIIRAFEVEDTTAVYSGILRMSDLIALQPQFQIKLHIVAPEERREKVRQQILRPTFTYMEGGPLAKICTFLSYDAVEELSAKDDLRFMKDTIVEEFEEVME